MKQYKHFFCVLCIGIISLFLLLGCDKQNTEEMKGNFRLYYVDNTKQQLVTIDYDLKADVAYEQVDELFREMTASSKKINYISAVPEDVKVESYYVSDQILYVDFSSQYYEMNNIEVMLCKAAVVLTMTQIEGIEYVSFTVNEQTILDEKGSSVMKASDFVDHSGSSINAYQELKAELYFANDTGDALVVTGYSGLYAQNSSVEKFIIERLIKGSTDNRLRRTIPTGTKLLSVNTKDGICYVNLNETFLEATPEVTPEVQLYSLVNSLVELSYVNKVQITINGETNVKFRDYVTLEYAFNRNLDIIQMSEHQ